MKANDEMIRLMTAFLDGRPRTFAQIIDTLAFGRATAHHVLKQLLALGVIHEVQDSRPRAYSMDDSRFSTAAVTIDDEAITIVLTSLAGDELTRQVTKLEGATDPQEVVGRARLLAQTVGTTVLTTVVATNDPNLASWDPFVRIERYVHAAGLAHQRLFYPDAYSLYVVYVNEDRVERGIVINGAVYRGAGGMAGIIDTRSAPESSSGKRALGNWIGTEAAKDLPLLNPSVAIVATPDGDRNGELIAGVREAIYRHSDPALTNNLSVVAGTLDGSGPLVGARLMAEDLARSPLVAQTVLESAERTLAQLL